MVKEADCSNLKKASELKARLVLRGGNATLFPSELQWAFSNSCHLQIGKQLVNLLVLRCMERVTENKARRERLME